MAHAAACAGALAVQQVIEEDRLLERVRARGESLRALLEDLLGENPHVGDIRGRGLFIGIELVEDRETKRPFAAAKGIAAGIKAAALRNGLICYPAGGTADGTDGDHVLIAPPFIIATDEIEELASRLDKSIVEVLVSKAGMAEFA
jgi:adenosylmethionine-8-amino-7-oxononanoate aminotransferase